MKYPLNRVVMYAILVVVGANYLAQIPYYLHLYYFPHHAAPSLLGTALLAATFTWFLSVGCRYRGVAAGRASGCC